MVLFVPPLSIGVFTRSCLRSPGVTQGLGYILLTQVLQVAVGYET